MVVIHLDKMTLDLYYFLFPPPSPPITVAFMMMLFFCCFLFCFEGGMGEGKECRLIVTGLGWLFKVGLAVS